MKKSFALVFILLVIIFIILFVHFSDSKKKNLEIMKFNSEYEIFNNKEINGLDITTVINKAVSNNEKYAVQKDDKGHYDINDDKCIEIYINMIIDDDGNRKTYGMESFNQVGMSQFISSFAEAKFRCTSVEYHESTKKVKSMTFELLD